MGRSDPSEPVVSVRIGDLVRYVHDTRLGDEATVFRVRSFGRMRVADGETANVGGQVVRSDVLDWVPQEAPK